MFQQGVSNSSEIDDIRILYKNDLRFARQF